MSYIVNFAGNGLHNYFKILNVRRELIPSRSNFTKDIPGSHVQYYTGFKYNEKKIILECCFNATSRVEHMEKVYAISDILNVKSPSQLTINDYPLRCTYAVPSGSIDISKFKYNGKFEIEF